MKQSRELEIGLKIDNNGNLSYFGLDNLNSILQDGGSILKIKEGDALMTKVKTQNGDTTLKLSGFSLSVVITDLEN